MTITDIEKFVEGEKELNRKKAVVDRVISTLISLVEKNKEWGERFFFEVPGLGHINLFMPGCSDTFPAQYTVLFVAGEKFNPERSLPSEKVLQFYSFLPAIVTAFDKTFPQAKIKEHFEFFAGQAPSR